MTLVSDKVSRRFPTGPDQYPDVKIPSNPLKEYISGGQYQYLGAGYARALPLWIDDLTADFGSDIYDRMMFDPKVASNVNVLKLSILANGVTLLGTVQDKKAPDYAISEEILEFCRANLDRIKSPTLTNALWQMLDAIAYGNKVSEVIYEIPKTGPLAGKMCLKHIKVKPRRVVAFVVDIFFNVVALLGLLPSYGMTSVITQGLIGIGAAVSNDGGEKYIPANIMPREKFFILSFRPKDSDPRGTSILRPAYEPWWNKQQTLQEWRRYLAQFASPSLVGKTAPNSMPVPETDSNGNVIPGGAIFTPEEVLASQLASFQNGSYLALPHGAEVTSLSVPGEGGAFHTAVNYYNSEITQAILNQTLATSDASHNARAASQTHQDVMGNVVQAGKNDLADAIHNDLLRVLVAWNYGEEAALKYTPTVSLSETEHQDFASNSAAIAQLWGAQYLDVSQRPGIDAMLGLPERASANDNPYDVTNPQQTPPDNTQEDNNPEGEVNNSLTFAIDLKPPKAVQDAAKEGLRLYELGYGGDGLEPDTIRWARKIARGEAITEEKARKGNRWFGRNDRFKDYPKDSPAYTAYMLWFGAPGKQWFASLVEQLDKENGRN